MAKQIFVNLPVSDLAKARTFYEAIGAVNNPQFSDETSAPAWWEARLQPAPAWKTASAVQARGYWKSNLQDRLLIY